MLHISRTLRATISILLHTKCYVLFGQQISYVDRTIFCRKCSTPITLYEEGPLLDVHFVRGIKELNRTFSLHPATRTCKDCKWPKSIPPSLSTLTCSHYTIYRNMVVYCHSIPFPPMYRISRTSASLAGPDVLVHALGVCT